MGNQFKTMSSDDFGKRVYKKINGWYSNEEQRLKDVKRIVEQREVIIGLLEKVQKVDADGEAHDEGDEHDPAVGVRRISLLVPLGHSPEYEGCEK